MNLTIIPLSNGLSAVWQSQTAEHSLTITSDGAAWTLQQYFQCSTMDDAELTWNARDRAMEWAMDRFARFCNEPPEEDKED